MEFWNTRQVAEALGVSTAKLNRAILEKRFKSPRKGPGGAYFWTEEDVGRASQVISKHDQRKNPF